MVKTIMADGFVETVGVVKLDPESNELDWVVTNPAGERYIVPHSKFLKKYERDQDEEGVYKSISNPVPVVQIKDNISFISSWGEKRNVVSGGYLIINPEAKIYGIQEKEFLQTYQVVDIVKEDEKGK